MYVTNEHDPSDDLRNNSVQQTGNHHFSRGAPNQQDEEEVFQTISTPGQFASHESVPHQTFRKGGSHSFSGDEDQGSFGDIDVVDDDEYTKQNVASGSVQQQPTECDNNGGFGSDQSGHGHSVMQKKVAVAPAEKEKPLARKQPRDACRHQQMNGRRPSDSVTTPQEVVPMKRPRAARGANGGNEASRPKARNEGARLLKKLRAGRIRKATRSGAPTKNDTQPAVQD
ncbi:hypothetical protein FGB62_75g013 [Gracilaria domingensis]|nr:hypothetical protein FGB62_75g013 [Gracilaria domingensis]